MNNEDGDILSRVSHVSIYTCLCGFSSAWDCVGHLVHAFIKSITDAQKYSLMIVNDFCVKFLILH